MKIKKIFKDIPILDLKGPKDGEVTGVASHSQFVAPGNLFIARKGVNHDGMKFIEEAVQAGASAIMTDIYNPTLKHVTQIIVQDVQKLESEIAARIYGYPSRDLFIAGVTGTNGKTTSTYLIKYFLEYFLGSSGLIGTIEYQAGSHRYPALHTTPDACTLHKLLREMVSSGVKACALEISSHALDQGRVDHLEIDVAGFTNLTDEHLDYHKTKDDYAAAKRKLFEKAASSIEKGYQKAVIGNIDSPWCDSMLGVFPGKKITYSLQNKANLIGRFTSPGNIEVIYKKKVYPASFPLLGNFNLSNLLLALGVVISQDWSLPEALSLLSTMPEIPGRLERIENQLGFHVFVDYAHTEDALIRVLSAIQEQKQGRIIVVFGCGGDRDRSKRPKMAEACEKYANMAIVTNDNPRFEDPQQIMQEILSGFSKKAAFLVQPDRKKAIQMAFEEAHPGDTVLIAGKGHESQQYFAHKTLFFDDRQVSREILEDMQKRNSSLSLCSK